MLAPARSSLLTLILLSVSSHLAQAQYDPYNLYQIGGPIVAPIPTASHYIGQTFEVVPDFDGDNKDDLLVSDADIYSLLLINVTPPAEVKLVSSATGSVLNTFSGLYNNDQFGWAIDAKADIDHDGLPDFIISEPRLVSVMAGTGTYPGEVHVFLSTQSYLNRIVIKSGIAGYDQFGRSITHADLDHDSFDDVIISDVSSVYVFSGAQLSSPSLLNGSQALMSGFPIYLGPYFGDEIVTGDFDGNGAIDLASISSYNTAVLFNLVGTNSFTQILTTPIPNSPQYFSHIDSHDLNRDGFSDLLISYRQPESLKIYLGSSTGISTQSAMEINPPGSSSYVFGTYHSWGSKVFVVDTDMDGSDEIVVASPGYVLATPGRVDVYSFNSTNFTASLRRTFSSSTAPDRFGSDMELAQINSDGLLDAYISAPFADINGQIRAGAIYRFTFGGINSYALGNSANFDWTPIAGTYGTLKVSYGAASSATPGFIGVSNGLLSNGVSYGSAGYGYIDFNSPSFGMAQISYNTSGSFEYSFNLKNIFTPICFQALGQRTPGIFELSNPSCLLPW